MSRARGIEDVPSPAACIYVPLVGSIEYVPEDVVRVEEPSEQAAGDNEFELAESVPRHGFDERGHVTRN